MTERMKNDSNLTRAQVWNLGVVATQLGISDPQEMSSMLVAGYRIQQRGEEIANKATELYYLTKALR
jgi:hypothetical protein